ncbi:MAG: class I SAM-dependent methyltransferase [Gemmataceae bacterium]|nr:class I SAM-dependent methyltransferase [Gemmataceae bacterium]
MNQLLNGVARAVAETFDLPSPILEIGSYQVAGQEEIANLRPLFPGKSFVGVDARPGAGVDFVADVERLPQPDASVGTVIAMNTFEHVRRFWRGFDEIHRVLRPDGALLVSCPFYFHVHDYPSDYWRFTPAALDLLLADYPTRILGWHGPRRRPLNVWALAFREERAPVTPAQFKHYRRLLTSYAWQPRSWIKTWRYWLGSLICGDRPLAPFLQRNHCETELHRSASHATSRKRTRSSPRGESVCPNPTAR